MISIIAMAITCGFAGYTIAQACECRRLAKQAREQQRLAEDSLKRTLEEHRGRE